MKVDIGVDISGLRRRQGVDTMQIPVTYRKLVTIIDGFDVIDCCYWSTVSGL